MESRVDTLMKDAISIMRRSENVFGISRDMMRQLPPEPSCQEAFEDLVMNFILYQEEKVKQLQEYMGVIGRSFSKKTKRNFCSEPGDSVKIPPDGVVIFDEKKLGSS
ncbi:hypothetical protein Tco_0934567 [Tanacetum coccineum]